MATAPDAAPLRVAVTGHRTIAAADAVRAEVLRVLLQLRGGGAPVDPSAALGVGTGGRRLVLLSALAEGADRLCAEAALAAADAALVAALPLPAADYERDFVAGASREEFRQLLARAARVEVLPPAPTREESYERAGRWCVDTCDILLALWDGRPACGRGGSAEIVAYARARGVPVCWIRSNDGPVRTEWLDRPPETPTGRT